MDPKQNAVFAGVQKHRTTTWHNPTKSPQKLVIDDGSGNKFLFEVPPGESRELDSRYDRAIHIVDCGRDECHRRGWFCHSGHEGMIVGGGAPMLRRVGLGDKLDTRLDPDAAARKAREDEVNKEVEKQKILAQAYERQRAEVAEATEKPAPTHAPQTPQKK